MHSKYSWFREGMTRTEYNNMWQKSNRLKDNVYNKNYLDKLKVETFTIYSKGIPKCNTCGIDDIDVLTIDHINNNGASHRREILQKTTGCGKPFYRWLKQNNWPEGYQVLCFNCNIKKHLRRNA